MRGEFSAKMEVSFRPKTVFRQEFNILTTGHNVPVVSLE